jgi:hypothetical protein
MTCTTTPQPLHNKPKNPIPPFDTASTPLRLLRSLLCCLPQSDASRVALWARIFTWSPLKAHVHQLHLHQEASPCMQAPPSHKESQTMDQYNDDDTTSTPINTSNFSECYKLERKLMSGSYGTVYVGVDLKRGTERRFAVKVVDRRCVCID